MEGAALAAKRRAEADISLAWHIEAFARQKRLKPLSKILAAKPKKRKMSPEEMLAVLQQFQAGGAPISIREVN